MRLLSALVLIPAAALAADPDAVLSAMDVPPDDVVSMTPSTSLFDVQSSIVEGLGPIAPVDGERMVLLSTGRAAEVTDGVDHDLGQSGTDPTEPGADVYDPAVFELTLRVPDGAHSFRFRWTFLSREYPFYVGQIFNDRFTVLQEGQAFDGNIVFDEDGNVVDVNNALFGVTDAESLQGTGFWRPSETGSVPHDGGATGWVTTTSPVVPGEEVSLRFDVHDVSDGVFDSAVLLDGFEWSADDVDDPVSDAPVEVHRASPKVGPTSGGEVVLHGRYFRPETRIWVGQVEVDPADVELLGPEALRVRVPPGEAGLVDLRAANGDREGGLIGGFTYADPADVAVVPEVLGVEPAYAPAATGREVVLRGRALDLARSVRLGDVELSSFAVVSPEEIRATVPAGAPATYALTVVDELDRGASGAPFVLRAEAPPGGRRHVELEAGCSATGRTNRLGLIGVLTVLALARLRRRVPRTVGAPPAALRRVSLLLVLALAGCSDSGLTRLASDPPVAEASVQRTWPAAAGEPARVARVFAGQTAYLDGRGSEARKGGLAAHEWTLIDGPDGAALETSAVEDGVVAAAPDVVGTWLLRLEVRDDRGLRSHPDAVVLEVVEPREAVVTLDWAGSHDLDLHVLDEAAVYYGPGDCHYAVPQPEWGEPGAEDDPRLLGDADGSGDRHEEVELPGAGVVTVLVHHLDDRGAGASVAPTLGLWVGGEPIAVDLPATELAVGEVLTAFRVDLATGAVEPVASVDDHLALGGPVLNERY